MALSVLLADESSTIKKVIQLALQDYRVEVTSVPNGNDVLEVTQSIKPDIIFADILLRNVTGYDVSTAVKQNPSLEHTPVVLMWSGFMELDEDKFQASMANAQLEKPFDVASLRKVIQQLVPNTKTQPTANFLHFPDVPSDAPPSGNELNTHPPATPASINQVQEELTVAPNFETHQIEIPPVRSAEEEPKLTRFSHEHSDSFKNVKLPPTESKNINDQESEETSFFSEESEEDDKDNLWQSQPLQKFQVDTKNLEEAPSVSKSEFSPEEIHKELTSNAHKVIEEKLFNADSQTITPAHSNSIPTELDINKLLQNDEFKKLVQKEAHKVAENITWQILPDMAKQIVQQHLEQLLSEFDKKNANL